MFRNILIVGGSDGIGKECARLFSEDQDNVYNISRTKCDLERVKNFRADVVSPGELDAAFSEVRKKAGNLDLLLYFAGFSMAAPVEYVKEYDVKYLFEVNYFGALRVVQRALPLMKREGGKIFFASSIGSVFPIFYDGFYSSSKAALENLARELRLEVSRHKISVTSLRIGGTKTDFTFKRDVYAGDDCGEYALELKNAAQKLAKIEQGGASPESVAAGIADLALRSNPPFTATLGAVNKLKMTAKRFLPERAILAMTKKMLSAPEDGNQSNFPQ